MLAQNLVFSAKCVEYDGGCYLNSLPLRSETNLMRDLRA